ncbi:MAG TPA: hypothetical protein VET23_10595 [Chitinophagaceae bacterium]|nr:hypothetical protein [Chitinophagaceae bacterium]
MRKKYLIITLTAVSFLLSAKKIDHNSAIITKTNAVTAVPVYRLVDPNGYHFYTTNEAEKNATIKDLGYHDEGILGYVFTQQVAGTVPLYRYRSELDYFTNIENNTSALIARHFYTTNQNDEELKPQNYGYSLGGDGNSSVHGTLRNYISEGIQCYVSPTNEPGTIPVYHLRQTRIGVVKDGDHNKMQPGAYDNFYTIDQQEKFSATYKYNYTDKGIAFYVWIARLSK